MLEDIIITVIGSSVVSTVASAVINRRRTKIDNGVAEDSAMIGRVNFLRDCLAEMETRFKKLEDKVCWKENCKERI
jgi:predicted thioesterase